MYNLVVRILVGFLLIRECTTGHPPMPDYTENIDLPVSIVSSILKYDNNTIANIIEELITDGSIFNITFTNESQNQKLIMKFTVNKEMLDGMTFSDAIRHFELRKRRRISAEILFLFCGIFILEIVHMVFLELFIRLTRTRFQGHKRFQFYTNMTMALTFLISVINLMLIVLFYRSFELYVQN